MSFSDKLSVFKKFKLVLKGILIGAFDVVPGISGGTIALILGIYEELILCLKTLLSKDFIIEIIKSLRSFKFKEISSNKTISFLIPVLFGILFSIFFVSYLIIYLLANQRSIILTFFIGLIIGSLIFLKNDFKPTYKYGFFFSNLGLFFGLLICFFRNNGLNLSTNFYFLFLGGFFAISAMLLPGISGSFVLYILGLYEPIYSALHNLNFTILLPFLVGITTGTIIATRIISYLLTKHKQNTLNFLIAFILGSLSVPATELYSAIIYKTLFFKIFLLGIFIISLIIPTILFFVQKKYFSV